MFDRIIQEITQGRNLVIDNEELSAPVDSVLLLNEIKKVFMSCLIDLKEANHYLESDREFAG